MSNLAGNRVTIVEHSWRVSAPDATPSSGEDALGTGEGMISDGSSLARSRRLPAISLAVTVLLGVGCTNSGVGSGGGSNDQTLRGCESAALVAALARATGGSTVTVGACRFEGSFTVPADVRLRGAGDATVISVSTDGHLTLVPGSDTTRLENLYVEVSGLYGVTAHGPGRIAVENVRVVRQIASPGADGFAVGMADLDGLSLTRVDIRGPVTQDNSGTDVFAEPMSSASVGLAVVNVDDATLEDVAVTGFARIGALLATDAAEAPPPDAAPAVRWNGGAVTENLGIGIYAAKIAVSLTAVHVERTLEGSRLPPAYGIVLSDAATTTTGLLIADTAGIGAVQIGGSAEHSALQCSRSAYGGLWAMQATSFRVIDGSQVDANRFMGIHAATTSRVDIVDTTVVNTVAMEQAFQLDDGTAGSLVAGDGLALVGIDNATLTNVTLEDNGRLGLAFDLGGLPEGAICEVPCWSTYPYQMVAGDVSVTTSTGQLGAIAGIRSPGTPPIGMGDAIVYLTPVGVGDWDEGISRSDGAAVADMAFTDAIGLPGGVTPSDLPNPSSFLGGVTPSD